MNSLAFMLQFRDPSLKMAEALESDVVDYQFVQPGGTRYPKQVPKIAVLVRKEDGWRNPVESPPAYLYASPEH